MIVEVFKGHKIKTAYIFLVIKNIINYKRKGNT